MTTEGVKEQHTFTQEDVVPPKRRQASRKLYTGVASLPKWVEVPSSFTQEMMVPQRG
jgi:hypothetical protein